MTEDGHPLADHLRAVFKGEASDSTVREVLRHLLHGCEICQAMAREEDWDPPSALRLTEADYEEPLRRAYSNARKHFRLFRKQLEQAALGIELLKSGGRRLFEEKWPEHLWNMEAYQALLDGAAATIADNPREAAEMAGLAFAISHNLSPHEYGSELVFDFQARAAAEAANAMRAADLLTQSEAHFTNAFDLFQRGTRSPWLHAHLLFLVGSLYAAQRQWSLTFGALDAAHKTFLELGDRHHAGKALIKRALFANYNGQTEVALENNRAGLAIIDPLVDPKLETMAKYNQILFLADCGKFREADRAIFEGRAGFKSALGRAESIKLRWLEGRVDAGLGRFPSAERRLTEARDGFSELEMKFAAALISLELSHVCLRWKKARAAADHAFEAEAVFRELKIYREQIVAVAILAECFRQRVATPKLVQDVIAFVSRAEHNPGKTFELRPV